MDAWSRIESYTLMRHVPELSQMRNALSNINRSALRDFDRGFYRLMFTAPQTKALASEAKDWARAYTKYGAVLEKAAEACLTHLSMDSDEQRLKTVALASEWSRKSRAGVCTDISPAFEAFVATHTPALMPPVGNLATTKQQTAVMTEAVEMAGRGLDVYSALCDSTTVDDFLRVALAYVMQGNNVISWETYEESAVYREIFYRWFGRSRRSSLTAIRAASAGMTLDDGQQFADAGIELEYALALTQKVEAE